MFSSARALVTAGAAVLALAAAAPAAQADVRFVYEARFDVTASYAAAQASANGLTTQDSSARLELRGWFHDLRFLDGNLLTARQTATPVLRSAAAESHYVNREGNPPKVEDCFTRRAGLDAPGALVPLRSYDLRLGGTEFGFTPFSAVEFFVDCGSSQWPFGVVGRMHGPGDLGVGHLRARLEIPSAKLGDSVIELPISTSSRSLTRCPGDETYAPDLRSCVTSLTGTIRFIRTYIDPVPADELALAPLTPSRPKLDRAARRASATVRCPRGCRYRIRIFLPPRSGRGRIGSASSAAPRASAAAASDLIIASAAGRLPASRGARTIAVAIPAGRQAEVVAEGGAMVQVALDPPKGGTVVATSFARAG